MAAGGWIGLVTALVPAWPWWASLLVVFACLAVYICRQVGLYRLCSKALDKAKDDQVPQVVTAFMARNGGPPGAEQRQANDPPAPLP